MKYQARRKTSKKLFNESKFHFDIFPYLISFSFLFILAIATLFYTNSKTSIEEQTNGQEDVDMSKRINEISKNLEDTSKEISRIQKELEDRIDFVDQLKKEAEIAENVISLSEEQLNAVQAQINKELAANRLNDSILDITISVLINTIFYILGLVTQTIINRRKKRYNASY